MASPRRLQITRGTIALGVCCLILLLIVPIAWLLLPLTKPQTVEHVRAEVSAHVDDVVATIPADLVLSDDQTVTEVPCPTDDGVRAVQLRRVIVVDESFDVHAWTRRLRDDFNPADGWHVRTDVPDASGDVVISLRGSDLSLVNVQTEDADAGTELTMTSWSSCTAA